MLELFHVSSVAHFIPFDFLFPKLEMGIRQGSLSTALVPVPKATVDKNGSAVFLQHNIRIPGQSLAVKPITEATSKEIFSHYKFGAGVLVAHGRHTASALLRC